MLHLRNLSILSLACLGALFPARVGSAQDVSRPNIVVILADDMGYADVGFHGCKDIPTPNLDNLAKSGVRCTNGYVSGPYCSPTRAGLLTGRYQNRFGHEFNPGGGGAQGLPLSEMTMANRMRALGYATGLVGKWHLGGIPKMHPLERGFQEYFGFLGGAHTYFPNTKGKAILRATEEIIENEYLTDAIGREAVSFIDRHKKEPFFLYVAFNAVHTPMEASTKYLDRFPEIKDKQRRTYAAMLSAMDDAVGKVMAKLRDLKQEENTIIFFLSDNGGPTMVGTTVNGSSNFPLRGSKRTTLEGGIRVPFVVVWKGKLPAGKVYDHPVIQLDILPTALAAAGFTKSLDKTDGVNLLPFLKGQTTRRPHEKLYWRFGDQMAIRSGDWSLVRYDLAVYAKEKGKAGVSPLRLYNLAKDIGQTTDLAEQHPDVVRELQTAWNQWNSELVPPLWGGQGKGKKKAE